MPPQRLLPALQAALIASGTGNVWRIRGVQLVATDLGLSQRQQQSAPGAVLQPERR